MVKNKGTAKQGRGVALSLPRGFKIQPCLHPSSDIYAEKYSFNDRYGAPQVTGLLRSSGLFCNACGQREQISELALETARHKGGLRPFPPTVTDITKGSRSYHSPVLKQI